MSNVEDDLIKLCDDYLNSDNHFLDEIINEEEKKNNNKTKKDIRDISIINTKTIVKLSISKLIIMLTRYMSLIHANITYDIVSQDKSEILKDLEIKITKIIDEFGKNETYIKELKRLYGYISKACPSELYNIQWIIDALVQKDTNLHGYFNSLLNTTTYALQGVNCHLPNFVYDNSKDNNEEIEFRLEMTRNIKQNN